MFIRRCPCRGGQAAAQKVFACIHLTKDSQEPGRVPQVGTRSGGRGKLEHFTEGRPVAVSENVFGVITHHGNATSDRDVMSPESPEWLKLKPQ